MSVDNLSLNNGITIDYIRYILFEVRVIISFAQIQQSRCQQQDAKYTGRCANLWRNLRNYEVSSLVKGNVCRIGVKAPITMLVNGREDFKLDSGKKCPDVTIAQGTSLILLYFSQV